MMKEIYYRKMLTIDDLALTPVYFILILMIAYFIRNLIVGNDEQIKKYFIPGLIFKLFGSIAVGMIYFFYYNGGDTTEYYNNALVMYGALSDDPIIFLKLLLQSYETLDPSVYDYKDWCYFRRDPSSYFFGQITGFFSVFGLSVYTPTALLIAAFSYIGIWCLFMTFYRIYPDLHKEFAIAVLFIPSVIFWGSGILKDCFTLSSAGLCVFSFYNIFIARKRKIANLIILALATFICLKLKPYIIIALFPGLFFWSILIYRSRIESPFIKFLAGPLAIVLAGLAGYLAVNKLGNEFSKYSISGVLQTAEIYQDWHTILAEAGSASGYSLGTIDGSTRSIITKIPAAINVTLFRPYIFEVRNPVMLLSAVESMFLLIFTIRILWKTGVRITLRAIFNNPTAFFCFFYALFFAFCVGFTAYNFGALVRYKIPCIPFYLAGLYILNKQTIIELSRNKKTNSPGNFSPETQLNS